MADAPPIGSDAFYGQPDSAEGLAKWKWIIAVLVVSVFLGLAQMIIPAYWIMAGLALTGALIWLAFNPTKLFYLLIFTIPFTDRVRVLPISFSLNELVILFMIVTVLAHIVYRGLWMDFRTRLDGWIAALAIMFLMAGAFSESSTGLLGCFKIFEGFLIFYVTVWFLRTKQLRRSDIIRALLITAVSQAALGTFQSWTSIGSDFHSERGYLGYLGLGSKFVWHGRGTTWHFNTLGNFLATNLLIFLPIYLYLVKNKRRALMWGGVIILGLLTTYSRGSILGLASGILFMLAVIQPNWRRSIAYVSVFVLVLLPVIIYFSNTSYIETVSFNERLSIWQVPLAAITSSSKAFWFGSGLNSYSDVAWPFIPAWVPPNQFQNWFAHNFYLLTVIEVGLFGAILFFSFVTFIWIDTWRQFKRLHGALSVYSLSLSVAIVTIFFVSIFDHTFASPHFKVFLFLILGLLYGSRLRSTTIERPA